MINHNCFFSNRFPANKMWIAD